MAPQPQVLPLPCAQHLHRHGESAAPPPRSLAPTSPRSAPRELLQKSLLVKPQCRQRTSRRRTQPPRRPRPARRPCHPALVPRRTNPPRFLRLAFGRRHRLPERHRPGAPTKERVRVCKDFESGAGIDGIVVKASTLKATGPTVAMLHSSDPTRRLPRVRPVRAAARRQQSGVHLWGYERNTRLQALAP